jgi:protein-S-isoprenylcysteine O-methyltransferase Ste14
MWTAGQYVVLVPLIFGGGLPSPVVNAPWTIAGWSLITVSGALAGWAIWSFRKTRISVTPLVLEGGQLIVSGPYRWVRHPMYSSLLLLAAGLIALDPTWLRITSAIVLIPALIGKLTVEEELLRQSYPEYDTYRQSTVRLIPGLW